MGKETFEIRDFLIKNNYSQGLINLLDDYFINMSISKEEIDEILQQANVTKIIDNYQLRGVSNV
ncbi:hypothetical protein ACR3IL_03075 [Streptococcus iniae]|uniref:hypothetical protein n=1 Tax=Streptococcus iniae TaxID=1346 RepID=UPI00037B9AC8|nr:hypothetical protein [Streptococcus iniae]ESR08786.1 hypothetical protein IUSA1_10485 [Streptococcus iniae IUSA1]OHX28004.1 hypothetical protein BKX95_02245 [Streptococcus iniae]